MPGALLLCLAIVNGKGRDRVIGDELPGKAGIYVQRRGVRLVDGEQPFGTGSREAGAGRQKNRLPVPRLARRRVGQNMMDVAGPGRIRGCCGARR